MKPQTAQPSIRRAALSSVQRRRMTEAVLARTSGSACQRATTLLGGQRDEAFDPPTRALVDQHLQHCDSCRAVARTLADVQPVLVALVSIEPSPAFAAEVVAATAGRAAATRPSAWSVLSRRPGWVTGFSQRAADVWDRLLARPRLSLELAYLATVLLVIVVGNPGLVADALGARANAPLAGRSAGAVVGTHSADERAESSGWVLPPFVQRAMREVESKQASAAKGWNWLVDRASQWVSASWNWLRGLFGWVDIQPRPIQTEPSGPRVRASQ